MSALRRWWRFNVVGAVGALVQLASLYLLNRWAGGRYLLASAIAIELTVLHNFVWHVRYTWRDRREGLGLATRLVRFHLSNGVVSMVGNLVLMRVLVGARVPVLAANCVAIACCSVVNFVLSDRWTFNGVPPGGTFS